IAVERASSSFLASKKLPHADGHCVARTPEISQPHGDHWSGCNSARHSDVDYVQARVSGNVAEIRDLGRLPADGHLRRNHAPVNQPREVDGKILSGNRGV